MPIDLERFKSAYKKWVTESLPFYQAGDTISTPPKIEEKP